MTHISVHDTPQLQDMLVDAGIQWFFMKPALDDTIAKHHGRKFIYAIDSNLIAFWANPEARARRTQPRQGETLRFQLGFGQIFRDDPSELTAAIARGLASYIFGGQLTDDAIPLIVLPDQGSEVDGMMRALLAKEKNGNGDTPELRAAIQKETELLRRNGLTVDNLRAIAPRLQELVFQNLGPPNEISRIHRITREGRIAPLRLAPLPAEVAKILRSPDLRVWAEYSVAKNGAPPYDSKGISEPHRGWMRRLADAGNWKTQKLLENDASTLAMIEVWNRFFEQEEKVTGGILNWRILYITGDHRLFYATHGLYPDDKNHDFSRRYLRHPRAYLDREGILAVRAESKPSSSDLLNLEREVSSVTLANWFGLIGQDINVDGRNISNFWTTREGGSITIKKAIDNIVEHFQDEVISLPKRWADYTRDAIVSNPPDELSSAGLDKLRLGGMRAWHNARQELDLEIQKRRFDSLREYFSVTATLGYPLRVMISGNSQIQSAPAIFFERWFRAHDFIEKMRRQGSESFDYEGYRTGLEELNADDPSGYSFFLAHAALFAGQGHWRNGALLARYARETIPLLEPEQRARGAHGREAAYFECVCRRISAADHSELLECKVLINEAEKVFGEEKNKEPSLDVAAERFKAEEINIRHAECLFSIYSEKYNPKFTEPLDKLLISVSKDYMTLCDHIERQLNENRPDRAQDTSSRNPSEARQLLKLYLLASLLSLGLIGCSPAVCCDYARLAYSKVLRLIQSGDVNPEQERPEAISKLTRIFLKAAECRDHFGQHRTKTLLSELNKLVDDVQNETMISSVDKNRLSDVLRVARRPWPRTTELTENMQGRGEDSGANGVSGA